MTLYFTKQLQSPSTISPFNSSFTLICEYLSYTIDLWHELTIIMKFAVLTTLILPKDNLCAIKFWILGNFTSLLQETRLILLFYECGLLILSSLFPFDTS